MAPSLLSLEVSPGRLLFEDAGGCGPSWSCACRQSCTQIPFQIQAAVLSVLLAHRIYIIKRSHLSESPLSFHTREWCCNKVWASEYQEISCNLRIGTTWSHVACLYWYVYLAVTESLFLYCDNSGAVARTPKAAIGYDATGDMSGSRKWALSKDWYWHSVSLLRLVSRIWKRDHGFIPRYCVESVRRSSQVRLWLKRRTNDHFVWRNSKNDFTVKLLKLSWNKSCISIRSLQRYFRMVLPEGVSARLL